MKNNEKYYLDNEERRILSNYKKISSFINYLKDYEIPYKIVIMEDKEDKDYLVIDFKNVMYCGFERTPQNMKTFNELKEKWNF